ncbi:hypothetical protein [Asticcacaulis sp. YBE204]|uniref:hypothetical protein n=1 Tax=Asticcacaulis sp. YBE204 TaxID=1282363 RepID=UPI0003C3E81E|nr:hypothetical protein [Asticcacaulis sp. YBE204]ESQ76509.1 hypothetical protein AEYBE204_19140 [Asticcacaulis sp. YBE204]
MMIKGTILALGLLVPAAVSAQTCPNPTATLDQAVAKTQAAVKSNDATAFLTLVGSQGLMLGSEGPQASKAQLSADFKAKKGAYCELFTCAGKVGRLKKLLSVPNPAKRLNTARNGNVFGIVTLSRGHATDEVELSYALVSCKWELTAIGTL